LKTSAVKEAISYLLSKEMLEEDNQEDDLCHYKTSAKGEEALILFYKLVTKYFESNTCKKILHWSQYED